jgi:hypothetical protein
MKHALGDIKRHCFSRAFVGPANNFDERDVYTTNCSVSWVVFHYRRLVCLTMLMLTNCPLQHIQLLSVYTIYRSQLGTSRVLNNFGAMRLVGSEALPVNKPLAAAKCPSSSDFLSSVAIRPPTLLGQLLQQQRHPNALLMPVNLSVLTATAIRTERELQTRAVAQWKLDSAACMVESMRKSAFCRNIYRLIFPATNAELFIEAQCSIRHVTPSVGLMPV